MNVRGNIPTKFSLGIFRGHFRQTSGPRNFLGSLFPRNSVGKFRGISEERRNSEELFPTTCFVGFSVFGAARSRYRNEKCKLGENQGDSSFADSLQKDSYHISTNSHGKNQMMMVELTERQYRRAEADDDDVVELTKRQQLVSTETPETRGRRVFQRQGSANIRSKS
ncbi:hypothetical protein F2Q70_00036265 [Brassica cretica]|uniref:Uncharacterized protein n=1 Tax=Brassica cretica TaxID=69181 RepID=A0A8S9K0B7_BRACR|nr:hypothetical protein F2Q70_00036265 [Brassica cretica]